MKRFVTAIMSTLLLSFPLLSYASSQEVNPMPTVLPALREWSGGSGFFVPDEKTKLVKADNAECISTVQRFFEELTALKPEVVSQPSGSNEIVFAIDSSLGSLGSEGYNLVIEKNRVTVTAPTEKGLLYGGTTIVQILYADKALPCGSANDYPVYAVRAGMIDVGRAWIPLDYLAEITRYMAFFKLNEVHLHINDRGANDYSAFRLESDVKGLTATDGFYTKSEYRDYQKRMLKYGIKVITEIDSPAHAACFAKAEGNIPFLYGENRYLDITKPEVTEFIKKLFAEYMTGDDPVFVGDVVHIGTDEYPREYSEQMRAYTSGLIDYVNSLGYTPRFWGSFGEGGFSGSTPVSGKAQANYWNDYGGTKETLLEMGYDIINTNNSALYVVPTGNYGFPDYFNLETLYTLWQANYLNLTGTVKMEEGTSDFSAPALPFGTTCTPHIRELPDLIFSTVCAA